MMFSLLLTSILVMACTYDVRTFRIPNAVSIAIVALFVIKVTAIAEIRIWPDHIVAAGLILCLGFAAFSFGIMGGGDAKLMTVLALWFGMTAMPSFLTITAIGGGVLALLLLTLRSLFDRQPLPATSSGSKRSPRLLDRKAPIPYALPITVAALWLEWS